MPKRNKYFNIKTMYNGVKYDSRKEATRSYQLDMLLKCGRISDLERQKRFVLQDKYINNKGEHIRAIEYVADFVYYDNDRQCIVVEDVKGLKTDVYKLKKKLFEYRYKDYVFEEI